MLSPFTTDQRPAVDVEAFRQLGDPLCEALVHELRASGVCGDPLAAARQLARDGSAGAVAFFNDVETVPTWVDFDALHAGAKLGGRYPEGLLFAVHCTVPFTYVDPGVPAVMLRTGRFSGAGAAFERRFWETASGFVGALDVEGMRPGGRRWEEWVRIRLLHTVIRLNILKTGRWDPARGLPINQAQTASGAHMFGRYRVNVMRHLGAIISDEEAEGFEMMWRWIAKLEGADPSLLGTTSAEQLPIQAEIASRLYGPNADSIATTQGALDGLAAMRSFPLRAPRRVHAAIARRLLAPELVEVLPGRDLPDDLGIEPDRLGAGVVSVGRTAFRAINQLMRCPPVRRSADRRGLAMLERHVDRGLQRRRPDHLPAVTPATG